MFNWFNYFRHSNKNITSQNLSTIPNFSTPDARINFVLQKLKDLIQKNKSKKNYFNILEIGAYIGMSTLKFGDILYQEFGDNFKIFTIDPYKIKYGTEYKDAFPTNIIKDGYVHILEQKKIFENNISRQIWKKNHTHLLCNSQIALKDLKKNKLFFNFIYIDGSHAYSEVINDFENSYDLLNEDGMLIGDDYELSYNEIFSNIDNEEEKEKMFNLILKERESNGCLDFRGKSFHPGILLAMHKLCSRFNIQKSNDCFFLYK